MRITQRLLDTEMILLRTIAEKDRRLTQALTRAKFAEQGKHPGLIISKPNPALEEEDIRTETGSGTLPIRVLTFGNFAVYEAKPGYPI